MRDLTPTEQLMADKLTDAGVRQENAEEWVREVVDGRQPATLREYDDAIATARARLAAAVLAKREAGWSWQKVGDALGVSRQAAWERFHE